MADLGGGMSVCCTAGPLRLMDGRIVRRGIISSCQLAATSDIVKRFWSRVHVLAVL